MNVLYLRFLSRDQIRIGSSSVKIISAFDGSDLQIAASVKKQDVTIDGGNGYLVAIYKRN